jgi:hypothetical protein
MESLCLARSRPGGTKEKDGKGEGGKARGDGLAGDQKKGLAGGRVGKDVPMSIRLRRKK